MKILKSFFDIQDKIPVEKKLSFGFGLSITVVIMFSVFWFHSKLELHKTSELIVENSKLRVSIHMLISSLNQLEAKQNRSFFRAISKEDSLYYSNTFNYIKSSMNNIELLIDNDPLSLKYLDSLKSVIQYHSLTSAGIFSLLKQKDLNKLRIKDRAFRQIYGYLSAIDRNEEKKSFDYALKFQNLSDKSIYIQVLLLVIFVLTLSIFFGFTIKDVKKRRDLAAKVSESQKKLKTIIDAAPEIIFVKGLDKKFELVNSSYLRIFDVDEQNIIGKDNSSILSKADYLEAKEEDEQILKGKKEINNIERLITINIRKAKWFKINKAPIFDEYNNLTGIVGIMTDITEIKEYETALKNSKEELSKLIIQKDKLFSIIAHDLRSPFSGLLGFSELLLEDFNNISTSEKILYISNINSSLKNLLSLIDNLLTWARLNLDKVSHEPKIISLDSIINSVFRSLAIVAKNKNIILKNNVSSNYNSYADPDMIETIIRNLVSNAIKYTNENGEVSINIADKGNNITVSVGDNGLGMSPEMINNLFKDGTQETTNGTNGEAGTGLGLLICKEFVEMNNGKIWVESKLGKGSKFYFTLPKAG